MIQRFGRRASGVDDSKLVQQDDDTITNLVADHTDGFDVLSGRVVEYPVLVALAG